MDKCKDEREHDFCIYISSKRFNMLLGVQCCNCMIIRDKIEGMCPVPFLSTWDEEDLMQIQID